MTSGGGDDPRDTSDRPRKSWREIDASRDRARSRTPAEQRPSSPAAKERAAAAAQQYLRQLDGSLFSNQAGGAEGERLARVVREAHGTPGFDAACQAHCEALGVPEDPALLTLFLDAKDLALLVNVLDALVERTKAGRLRATSGLRTQLRLLSQSPDDAVAERAEELLTRL